MEKEKEGKIDRELKVKSSKGSWQGWAFGIYSLVPCQFRAENCWSLIHWIEKNLKTRLSTHQAQNYESKKLWENPSKLHNSANYFGL